MVTIVAQTLYLVTFLARFSVNETLSKRQSLLLLACLLENWRAQVRLWIPGKEKRSNLKANAQSAEAIQPLAIAVASLANVTVYTSVSFALRPRSD